MFIRRKLVLISFALAICIVLLLPFFNCNYLGKTPSYHSFIKSEDFQKLSQEDKVLKCASCHKQEYENEKHGPHANAYKNLLAHREYVNDPHYESAIYKKRVNTVFESCAGCHSSRNLFETILKDHSNMDTLTAHVMAHPLPAVRADIPSRSTGLNCFTCHFDGKDFISLKSFDAPEHAKDPKQSLSLVAKNNMTCYPCHFDVLDSFNPGIAITRTGSMVCVNCHVETDQQNKKTHYFYWKGNVDKVNPLITNILNDFRFGWAGDKKAIDIHWENKSMPHTLPIATELLFNIEVLSKDSVVLSKKTIRLNRKKQYDKDNYEDYGNNYLGGIVGDDMPLFASRNYTIPFDSKTAASLIRISYVDKSQFWLHDSIGHTLSSRVLNLAE